MLPDETRQGAAAARDWDALHTQPRYRPRFPQDDVVRFLAAWFDTDVRELHALDVGVGGGRHTRLLCELGFATSGVDISAEGLRHAAALLEHEGRRADLRVAPMSELPFDAGVFDVAISYGVMNYADRSGMVRGIAELYRVMKPGARALAMLRTTDDYRCGRGRQLGPQTFALETDETSEAGLVQHFLSEADVPQLFAAFDSLAFEKREATFDARRAKNSDWTIRVTR